jgi:uncharacterized protein (DUF1697 family)
MPRYAAFLRGISPMNCKMPELKRSFEQAGFTEVRTLLSSGNVVFDARKAAPATLQRKAEAAMEEHLGRSFLTIVRPVDALQALLETDPFSRFKLPAGAKRVVTFLAQPPGKTLKLPLEVDGARIVAMQGQEVFTAYVPSAKGALFMGLIERTFGKALTTRTWDTVAKCAAA